MFESDKLLTKLEILADAAKYDASCASSGAERRDSMQSGGIGSTSGGMGICHSYTPDGRCIALLKILLTNFCIYECAYCVNRASSEVPRARFSPEEVAWLTMEFYKRNYIEGLFLSSGIIRNADYTMEQVVAVARSLRLEHNFRGYIHLKTIPEADPDLLAQAGLYADRLSINVELPSAKSLQLLAPEKSARSIDRSMANLKEGISAYKESKRDVKKKKAQHALPQFSPSGQSTQMIVGADQSDDAQILSKSHNLYKRFKLKRVYYSAFSPIPDASSELPLSPAPLMREHRLYQADWLLRFYGFTIDELAYSGVEGAQPAQSNSEQMLALDKDPKLAWALRHLEDFPVNLNTADYETILRVPGIGVTTAKRLVSQRRVRAIRFQDLKKLRLAIDKVALFVQVLDHRPSHQQLESTQLERRFSQARQTQLDLFSA